MKIENMRQFMSQQRLVDNDFAIYHVAEYPYFILPGITFNWRKVSPRCIPLKMFPVTDNVNLDVFDLNDFMKLRIPLNTLIRFDKVLKPMVQVSKIGVPHTSCKDKYRKQ